MTIISLPIQNKLGKASGRYEHTDLLDEWDWRIEQETDPDKRARLFDQIRYIQNKALLELPMEERVAKIQRSRHYRNTHGSGRPFQAGYAGADELDASGWTIEEHMVDDAPKFFNRSRKQNELPRTQEHGTVRFANEQAHGLVYDIETEQGVTTGEFYHEPSSTQWVVVLAKDAPHTWDAYQQI